jgi:hypothetical protein
MLAGLVACPSAVSAASRMDRGTSRIREPEEADSFIARRKDRGRSAQYPLVNDRRLVWNRG